MPGSFIRTPTGNLDLSREFYSLLGFTELAVGESVLVTDGAVLIEIDPTPGTRTGLCLVADSWGGVLDAIVPAFAVETEGGHYVADPNGVRIYLLNGDPRGLPDPKEAPAAHIGNFVGLTVEAVDFEATVGFWLLVGYDAPGGQTLEGWAALTASNGIDLSVLDSQSCPHLFFNPGLTYFNGDDNLRIIEHIREVGIPIDEEITTFNDDGVVDNIIIRDPGGTGFFVFND